MTTHLGREDGTTLIEVLISVAILMTLMAGLMSLMGLSINTTENQGHLAARTTEYAQDKMEQLMALSWGDAVTDTRVFPAATSGGTGLNVDPANTGATTGGSSNTASPVDKYVDYLDQNGNLCGSTGAGCLAPSGMTPPSGWFYQRVWEVKLVSANLKQITVTATIARGFGGGNKAASVLTVLKSSPF